MKKLIIILSLLTLLMVTGCIDNTRAIQHCDSLGLQSTGKIFGCDIQCVNATSGQLFYYDGQCKLTRK